MDLVTRIGVVLAAGVGLTAASCDGAGRDGEVSWRPGGSFIERFDGPVDERLWYIADGFGYPGALYDTAWDRSYVETVDGAAVLSMRPEKAHGKNHTAGNIQFREKLHYGRYEGVMTVGKGVGTVSAFFTYTGPYYGDEQDEIDFEFLGKDTTQVQLNYFVDGRGGNEVYIDLGYDASVTPNLYAIEWAPGAVRWFVGDVMVREETGPVEEMPESPGLLFTYLWSGARASRWWLGHPVDYEAPQQMVVECISFTRAGDDDAVKCSDVHGDMMRPPAPAE